MTDSPDNTPSKRANELLKAHIITMVQQLDDTFEKQGVHLETLTGAFAALMDTKVPAPEDIACKKGCAFCCHLRVGVSIPEAVVIYHQISSNATPEGFTFLQDRILNTHTPEDLRDENFWLAHQTPCPFLDIENQHMCLIYDIRPFSCRAYHSLDKSDCQKGYDQKIQVKIPCFPLFRSFTDSSATILMNSVRNKGLHSYQVGFISALQLIFKNEATIRDWLSGKDTFNRARIR